KQMKGIDTSTPQGKQEAAKKVQAIMQGKAPAAAKPVPAKAKVEPGSAAVGGAASAPVKSAPAPAPEAKVEDIELPEAPEEEEGPSAWELKAEEIREGCFNELGMLCPRVKSFDAQIACLKKERTGLLKGCRSKLVKHGYLKKK
ncbi:MAG: hypothetical protein V3S11_03280, partial [Elusimicrobiota bacterium]